MNYGALDYQMRYEDLRLIVAQFRLTLSSLGVASLQESFFSSSTFIRKYGIIKPVGAQ